MQQQRPVGFILASTDHGTMIVSRFDYKQLTDTSGFGVGCQLLGASIYDPHEVALGKRLLDARRRLYGDGVIAFDIGANVGVMSIEWGRHMTGWGAVYAFEVQDRIFCALAGNVVINNCFNVYPHYIALGAQVGRIAVPILNYCAPGSYGSLELRPSATREDIGQRVDDTVTNLVPLMTVDSMTAGRIDLLKIDVEGMELEVLNGAIESIERSKPMILCEHIKTDVTELGAFLDRIDYRGRQVSAGDVLALHVDDLLWETIDEIAPIWQS